MSSAPDPPASFITLKNQTYGRKTVHSEGNANSLLFNGTPQSGSGAAQAPQTVTDGSRWRQRMTALDDVSDEELSEESIEAMRARLRNVTNSARLPGSTSSTASSSALKGDAANEAPARNSTSPKSPLDCEVLSHERSSREAHVQSGDEPASSTPNPTPPVVSDDEGTPLAARGHGGPKSLSKADRQQMQKDIAQAERERPLNLSRPDQGYRPVSAWLKSASMAVAPSSSPGAGQGSDDIQQFTPSSAAKNDVNPDSSGTIVPASSSPSKSSRSPTRRPKQLPGSKSFPRFGGRFEQEEEPTLDSVFARASKQQALNARKKKALEQRKTDPTRPAKEDADSLVIAVSPSKLKQVDSEPLQPVPDARAILDRASSIPAPSKRRQQVLQWSGKQKSKADVSETHVDFAARKFGHADLRRANGGSRPAGQKKGRDEVIQQAQVDHNLLRNHQNQVAALAKTKEARYGGGRQLPPKQPLTIAPIRSSSSGPAPSDSESDGDYVDCASVGSSQDNDSHLDAADEGSDVTVTAESAVCCSPRLATATDAGSTSQRIATVDEEDEEQVPRLHRSKRQTRRVKFESDDEEPSAEPSHLEEDIREPQSAASKDCCSPPIDVSGFESGGGFSQLFGETQQAHASANHVDVFAGLREKQQSLLDPEALLPSANISESQALRDRALIGGEAEVDDLPPGLEDQVYLNSQGFFTQTRPADRSSPLRDAIATASSATLIEPAAGDSHAALSSTVLNSSSHQNASAVQPSLTRLKHRLPGDTAALDSPGKTSLPEQRADKADAYDVLVAGSRAAVKRQRTNFVDEQAEESDEDMGWFLPTENDRDEDGAELDDEDGYIPELVDDAALSEEEKRQLALQTAEKHREIAREDDARLEAEAKKVTEGFYRHKRRGNDFMSDEEEEDGKPRKLNKKQRRQRRLDREDGLYKIGGEENKFLETYEADLDSDIDFEEAPQSPGPVSPMHQQLSVQERNEMLRNRGRANRVSGATMFTDDDDDDSRSANFAISKRKGASTVTSAGLQRGSGRELPSASRSMESFSKFLADENSNPRRTGGGVSVVQRNSETGTRKVRGAAHRATAPPAGQDSGRDSRRLGSSNSILMDRANRFGR